ncbi:hypothetical protein AUC47_02075 [Microbacterium sp. SZ1]|uniref:LGFP repeat-containing protein n=1 Tax=Microbacterium sp. SZ1 TaxID=1849736 RepID=UPI000BBC242F|nr:hypothetical protein [Microbacterium sp. SZ1]PCE14949.1 hypothetical protein AUC47_02075 [Microbacterium sp. SZ1]
MTGSSHTRLRRLVSSAAAVVFAASLLVAVPMSASSAAITDRPAASGVATVAGIPQAEMGLAKAANLSLFRAGNIISDATFFNASTMSPAQIDSFFRGKVASCQSGYVCLKDYRQNTPNRPADRYCNGYSGAGNESAATIIYRVAQSCGINPQVFIVMLQKEQGLVTHTWPSSWRYDMALGQGCPDTAPCDPAYAGFFYQIYGAGRQMKIYAEGRYFTYYAPGNTWNILYHPNTACGRGPVYIENVATAALYYYTPYQPNRAALNAGYGTGDGCSSYGNRNFYQYFIDWFGSVSYDVVGGLATYWASQGGGNGALGQPIGAMTTWPNEGWSQPFAGGDVFQKIGTTAVHSVRGAFKAEYGRVNGFRSGLGWPTSDQVGVSGGLYQDFENGRIYTKSGGAGVAIAAPMFAEHEKQRNVFGSLGWPKARAYLTADGSRQDFDSGSIFANSSGVFTLPADIVSAYDRAGGISQMGSPTSTVVNDALGQYVSFTAGWIQRSGSTLVLVKGALGKAYAALGGGSGKLGAPTGAERLLPGGGWTQSFTGGALYHSSFGTYSVTGFSAELAVLGGVDAFGYPSAEAVVDGSRSSQQFGSRSIAKATPNGAAYVITGAIGSHYASAGGVKSFLGAPIAKERTQGGGWIQDFEGGRILHSAYGTFGVPTPIVKVLDANGGIASRIGWPIAAPVQTSDGWRQDFSGGTLLASTNGAKSGVVVGGIMNVARSYNAFGDIGYPVEKENLTTNGWRQRFDTGTIFVPNAYAPSVVSGAVHQLYVTLGGETVTGVPTGPATVIGNGRSQQFQRFGLYSNPATGTWQSNGLIRDRYSVLGGAAGVLGWPTESLTTISGGWRQLFTGGAIYSTAGGSVYTVKGSIGGEYIRRGAEKGALGWPVGNEALVGGLWSQKFQNGTLVLLPGGDFEVR